MMNTVSSEKYFSFKEIFWVTLVGMLGVAIWAVHSGQDLGPDLVNYHFYNAYLVFHKDRLLTDIFPAGIQGYLTPYIYVLIYSLYKILPPKGVGFVMGALHGLCFIAVYCVSRLLLANWSTTFSRVTAFLCAIFGIVNPFFWAMVGSSFSDNLTAPLVLIPLALVMMVRFPEKIPPSSKQSYFLLSISGLLMGFAVGFKLCNCAFVLGLFVAWFVGLSFSKKDILSSVILFSAICIGFLIVDAEWMWRLYSEFKSPMFPFYNDIFKSPMIGQIDTNVPAGAAAHSLQDFFAYPYRWAQGIPPLTEWNFKDMRFAILYTLIAGLLLVRWVPPFKKATQRFYEASALPHFILQRYWFIAIWSIVSYLFWIDQFGALRYLMPVTLLTGILMLICLLNLIPSKKIAMAAWLVLAVVALSTMQPTYFGRVKWRHSWYPVKIPQELSLSKNTLYLKNSLSFTIPFFPEDAQFIGLGYLDLQGQLIDKGKEILAHHRGPIRTLTLMPMNDASFYDQLKKYGLRLDARDCVRFNAGVYPFFSCRVERVTLAQKPIMLPLSNNEMQLKDPQSFWIASVSGFYGPEAAGMWTHGKTAKIYLAGFLPKQFKLRFNAASVIGDNAHLPFEVIIGHETRKIFFNNNNISNQVSFDLSSLKENKIIIKIPKPTAPHDINPSSGDTRKLGVLLHSITIS